MEKSPPTLKAEDAKIFADADAFVSTLNTEDANHTSALTISSQIKKLNLTLITSNFAVGEAITVLSQDVGLETALKFAQRIYQGEEALIIDVDRDQQLKALEKFSQATSKNVRFTDFVNMVLMEELAIRRIFSFDKHYQQTGFILLSTDE